MTQHDQHPWEEVGVMDDTTVHPFGQVTVKWCPHCGALSNGDEVLLPTIATEPTYLEVPREARQSQAG